MRFDRVDMPAGFESGQWSPSPTEWPTCGVLPDACWPLFAAMQLDRGLFPLRLPDYLGVMLLREGGA
jgi:hypothetical protein